MRCRKNEFIEGSIFHIYNHSISEVNLFREPEDYFHYIQRVIHFTKSNPIEFYAFCLIPDRFDFCVEQNTDYEVYRLFNRISTSYAMYYNRKYSRSGKLFAGKLQHKQIFSNSQLIKHCQNIHYKPVQTCLVKDITEWPYTNYLEYARMRRGCLYSEGLIKNFPAVFKNYSEVISEYKNMREEQYFQR